MNCQYGIDNIYIDVSHIVLTAFIQNNQIYLPPGQKYFNNYFSDLVPNKIKKLLIELYDKRKYQIDENDTNEYKIPINRSVIKYFFNEPMTNLLALTPNHYLNLSQTFLSRNLSRTNLSEMENNIALIIGFYPDNLINLSHKFKYVFLIDYQDFLSNMPKNIIFCQKSLLEDNNFGKKITFKNFLFDYIYSNYLYVNLKVGFIYCNLFGKEELILEDLLYFSSFTKNYLDLMIYLNNWTNIDLFDEINVYLESYYCYLNDQYFTDSFNSIKQNKNIHLFLIPKLEYPLVKKKNMSCCIIAFNNLTYVKNMVEQLKKYTNDIIIIDNRSNYPSLLQFYQNDYQYTLFKMPFNYGYHVIYFDIIKKILGSKFIVTDPDLKFNPNLPSNFIDILFNLQKNYQCNRIGFSLEINSSAIRPIIFYGVDIKIWESQFWKNKVNNYQYELYYAPIDTTFCMIDYNYAGHHIRIAGDFTCKHLPWYYNWENNLSKEELEIMKQRNISSNFLK